MTYSYIDASGTMISTNDPDTDKRARETHIELYESKSPITGEACRTRGANVEGAQDVRAFPETFQTW